MVKIYVHFLYVLCVSVCGNHQRVLVVSRSFIPNTPWRLINDKPVNLHSSTIQILLYIDITINEANAFNKENVYHFPYQNFLTRSIVLVSTS